MYKSSAASRARGEPTTPKLRPLELSPDMASPTRSEKWIQPAAEPRHRTTQPIKSALKKTGWQAPPPERPCRDVDGDSGYGSGSSNDHRSNGFVVHIEPLGPPGVSGSPQQPTMPLGEQDSNRHNPRSQRTQRSQRYLPVPAPPVIPPQVQAPMPPPVHPAGGSYRHDEITRPRRESHRLSPTVSEKFPQNTTSAEPRYGSISPINAPTTHDHSHLNYGATQGPRYPSHRHGVPSTGYPIYAPPHPSQQQQYPQPHYQSQYEYQGYPRRPGVENYEAGLSDNEGRRPPLLPRPKKYMPDGYSSDTGGMRQYQNPHHGGRPAPHAPLERLQQQDQQERLQQQQLHLQEQQIRGGAQPPVHPVQPNEPVGWVRLGDVLRMQGCDMNGHRLPTATEPRGWTEPPLLRGIPLSWPILEYKQRRRGPDVKPMVFFDISQDPDGTDGRGIRLLSLGDYGMDKDFPDEFKALPFSTYAKMRYINMKCTAPELEPWNVIIEHQEDDGIQVIDFFRAIYRTYQERLTPDELHKYRDLVNSGACQRAFKRRCRKAPGLTEYNERQGIRRVDLVGDRTLYLRLHYDSEAKRYEFDLTQQDQHKICDSQLVPYRN